MSRAVGAALEVIYEKQAGYKRAFYGGRVVSENGNEKKRKWSPRDKERVPLGGWVMVAVMLAVAWIIIYYAGAGIRAACAWLLGE